MNETAHSAPELPQPFRTSGPITVSVESPLSETARLRDTFLAPSRTFADILHHSSRWWLPFLLSVLVSYAYLFAIQSKVGWPQVVENVLKQTPKQQERLADMESTQASQTRHQMATTYSYFAKASPLFTLLLAAVGTSVLLATINFGFAGEASFGRLFALWMYATLPVSIKGLLGTVTLLIGMDPEQFDLQNAVGTNLGFYLPSDWNKGLLTLASWLDVFTLWTIVLLILGCAIIGRVKRSSAAIAVIGWALILALASTVAALINS